MRMFNVGYPSFCDTTMDLYMQAHELMKSSRIEGFCTNFFAKFYVDDPQTPPPFKYKCQFNNY